MLSMSESSGLPRRVARAQRNRRVWIWAAIALLSVAAFAIADRYWRQLERDRLITEIVESGGQVDRIPPWQQWWQWVRLKPSVGTWVELAGNEFDDDWLYTHDNLRALTIHEMRFVDTRMTDAGVARLLAAHSLTSLVVIGTEFGDAAASALREQARLKNLRLSDASITDEGLAVLPLEQVMFLKIDGTRVTPAGLHHLSRCQRLRALWLDARQIDEGLATHLRTLPQLSRLHVVGGDLTDEEVRLLHGIQGLGRISLSGGTVTAEAAEALQRSIPGCEVVVR